MRQTTKVVQSHSMRVTSAESIGTEMEEADLRLQLTVIYICAEHGWVP